MDPAKPGEDRTVRYIYRPIQHKALLQGLWERLARSINKPMCYRQQIINALTTVLSNDPNHS